MFLFIISLAALAIVIVSLTHISLLLRQATSHGDDKATGRKQQKESITEEPDRMSADFAALINAITNEGKAYRAEEEREDKAKQVREWLTIGLLACTLVAIAWQVNEMIRVYEPIKTQADASRISADAALKQAQSSETTVIQSERAWLGPVTAHSDAEPKAGEAIDVWIDYSNTGRSPAINFGKTIGHLSYSNGLGDISAANKEVVDWVNSCKGQRSNTEGGAVFPSTGFIANTLYYHIEKDEMTKHMTNDRTLVVIGCFVYSTFGIDRHSAFCYFFKPGESKTRAWNICPGGSYAD